MDYYIIFRSDGKERLVEKATIDDLLTGNPAVLVYDRTQPMNGGTYFHHYYRTWDNS